MTASDLIIYEATGAERFEGCHPTDRQDFSTLQELINGVPRISDWRPIHVELFTKDRGKALLPSDSPWLGGHAMVFRARVVDVLGDLLGEFGEILPLACPTAELYVFNPTRVLDAVDEKASVIWRFPSGKVMGIRRHVFYPDAIRGHDIFKITTTKTSTTFFSQRFVDAWNAAKLRGLDFDQVWPTP